VDSKVRMGSAASCAAGVEAVEPERMLVLVGNDVRATNLRRKSWKYILSLHG
jgi:hypothetical protein